MTNRNSHTPFRLVRVRLRIGIKLIVRKKIIVLKLIKENFTHARVGTYAVAGVLHLLKRYSSLVVKFLENNIIIIKWIYTRRSKARTVTRRRSLNQTNVIPAVF